MFLEKLSNLFVNKLMSQRLRLILGLVEALNAMGLLVVVINLLSLERTPTSSIFTRPAKFIKRSFRQHCRALLALKSSNASTLFNSLIVSWMATSFQRLTANPQRTFGPSWSVQLLAAPRSVGARFFFFPLLAV